MDFPLKIDAFKYSKKRRRYEKNGLTFDPVTKTAVSCDCYVFVKEIDGQLYMADQYAHRWNYSSRLVRNHRSSVFSLMRELGLMDGNMSNNQYLHARNATGLDDLPAALTLVPEWQNEEKKKIQDLCASMAISQMLSNF